MDIIQAVVVSDLHCGCQFGLCPPEVTLDGGGVYKASKLQRKVWNYWTEFWEEWVPTVTRGEPWILVTNGDDIDGNHHGINTLITSNIADQVRIAEECLRPHVERAAAYYSVRGTECHVGNSAEDAETLAQRLGAVPDAVGRFTRFELRLQLGRALIDIQHHISTVNSNAYETTALMKEYVIACEEAGRWGQPVPDVIVRSHRHRYCEAKVPSRKGAGVTITTPGWQLKTPLTYRMAGARQATPQFGGILIRVGNEDIYARAFVRSVQRSSIERPQL